MHGFCENLYSENCALINVVNKVVSFFTSLLFGGIWVRMLSIQCHWKIVRREILCVDSYNFHRGVTAFISLLFCI
jgi:hypothetical protein